MPKIEVIVSGYGTAYVNDPDPLTGEPVTLYCIPDEGESLEDIQAWEEHGYSVALPVQEEVTFTWNYESMQIYVYFSSPAITITIEGDGTATVSNDNPTTGEIVTLTCQPDSRRKIKSIVGYDENGNVVTFQNKTVQTFVWQYQTLEIIVTFKKVRTDRMPIWMYPLFRT